MTTTTLTNPKGISLFVINLFIATTLISLLFFIDEGAYSFEWAKDKKSLLFFFGVIVSILIGQTVAHKILLKNYIGKAKIFLTNLIGIPLGVASMWIIMSICGIIAHLV